MSEAATTNAVTTRRVRWWPVAAAVALAAAISFGLADGAEVAPVLAASAFIYLGAAALQKPSAAWPVFVASFVVLTIAKVLDDAFDPTYALVVLGAALVVYGLLRGAARPSSGLPLQSIAMVVVGAAAVIAPVVDRDLGGYIVAFGLLGHAGWDLYHHRTGRVVVRSMAEFCLVLDILLALAILAVTVLG